VAVLDRSANGVDDNVSSLRCRPASLDLSPGDPSRGRSSGDARSGASFFDGPALGSYPSSFLWLGRESCACWWPTRGAKEVTVVAEHLFEAAGLSKVRGDVK
jgi:hypothetical protein